MGDHFPKPITLAYVLMGMHWSHVLQRVIIYLGWNFVNGYQVILDLNVAHNYKFILYWFPNIIFSIVNWSYDYLTSELNKFSRWYKTGIYKTTKYICENLYFGYHYNDDIMSAIASQITSITIVYSTVYSGADQRKYSKLCVTDLCVWIIHRWPMNFKGPVTRKMLQLMTSSYFSWFALGGATLWSYDYCLFINNSSPQNEV